MKTKILLILALIALILIFISQQFSTSQLDFYGSESSEINTVLLRSIDNPNSISDKSLTDPDSIRELWDYFNSIKLKEVKSFETYTEPTNQWELIFHYNNCKGNSLEILYQGELIRQDGKIYIPAEYKVDIDNILNHFLQ